VSYEIASPTCGGIASPTDVWRATTVFSGLFMFSHSFLIPKHKKAEHESSAQTTKRL